MPMSTPKGSPPRATAPVVDEPVEEAPTPQEALHALTQARDEASTRLSALQALAAVQMLTEAEESEQLRLTQRLTNLTPILERLQKDVQQQQQHHDIALVVTQWEYLIAQKQRAYAEVVQAVEALLAAWHFLGEVHHVQEQTIATLPMQLQQKLFFIDGHTFAARVCQGMGRAQAWTDLLLQPSPLPIPRVQDMAENDPGSKPLPPRILAPFQQQPQER